MGELQLGNLAVGECRELNSVGDSLSQQAENDA